MSNDDMQYIATAIDAGRESGLEVEVVWSAIQAIRANPEISTQEAMWYAMCEWDV